MARQLQLHWCKGEGVLWRLCDDEMTAQGARESTIQFDSLQMMEERLGDWGKCQTVAYDLYGMFRDSLPDWTVADVMQRAGMPI